MSACWTSTWGVRPMLEVQGLHAGYGQTPVIHGLDLRLEKVDRIAILGRNGAGKSTLLRTIMGLITPTSGRVLVDGSDVTEFPSHDRARRGLAYVPQGRQIFPELSVVENLKVAAFGTRRKNVDGLVRSVYDEFPVLADKRAARGGSLSGGQQQMLALGRALVTEPRLLLLDEPSEGIQPSIVAEIGEKIRVMNRDRGIAIVLVEQNLEFAASVVETTHIMDKGEIVETVAASDFLANEELQRKYIGI